jgi:hypothetical protein
VPALLTACVALGSALLALAFTDVDGWVIVAILGIFAGVALAWWAMYWGRYLKFRFSAPKTGLDIDTRPDAPSDPSSPTEG